MQHCLKEPRSTASDLFFHHGQVHLGPFPPALPPATQIDCQICARRAELSLNLPSNSDYCQICLRRVELLLHLPLVIHRFQPSICGRSGAPYFRVVDFKPFGNLLYNLSSSTPSRHYHCDPVLIVLQVCLQRRNFIACSGKLCVVRQHFVTRVSGEGFASLLDSVFLVRFNPFCVSQLY